MARADGPTWSWLDRMAPTTRRDLLARGALRVFAAKSRLVAEGDEATSVMIVRSGLVAVVRSGHDEHGIFMAFRGPFELVGEIGVLYEQPRVADVVALRGDPVQVWSYAARRFLAFLDEHPDARRAAAWAAQQKLLAYQRRSTRYGRGDAVQRVAHVLLDHASEFGQVVDTSIAITVPLTQQRIADLIGSATDAVGGAFRRLKRAGAIRTGVGCNGRTLVLDRSVLVAFADARRR
ncbi:MAG: Crp/Fnr family transcriptional regulator [Pseudonocardia sp.]